MYVRLNQPGTIQFTFVPKIKPTALFVAGDFSNWQPLAMRAQPDGRFARVVSGVGQSFQYKFIVDGEWTLDPDHSAWALSRLGSTNSLGFSYDAKSPPVESPARKENHHGDRARP